MYMHPHSSEIVLDYVTAKIIGEYRSRDDYHFETIAGPTGPHGVKVFLRGLLLRVFLVETPASLHVETTAREWVRTAGAVEAVGARLWIAVPIGQEVAVRRSLRGLDVDATMYTYAPPGCGVLGQTPQPEA